MNPTPERRKSLFLLTAAAASPLLSIPGTAWAQSPKITPSPAESGVNGKPYDPITPPVVSDTNRVRFLFTYDCPYCRSYHNGLMQWGATLPKPIRFDATPVITSIDNDNLALAIYGRLVAQGMAPAAVKVYDLNMYALLQGDPESGAPGKQIITLKDVLRTLVQSGIDIKALQTYVKTKGAGLEKRLPDYAQLVKTYNVNFTPAISLVGRYLVHPDHANGNPQQFLLLLNGMISRIIQGGPNAL